MFKFNLINYHLIRNFHTFIFFAKKLNISRSYVSRIEKHALEKLNENMQGLEL